MLILANDESTALNELDANLRSKIVATLFDLFIQLETNLYNSQLLFSAHSYQALSRLNKYQVVLIKK